MHASLHADTHVAAGRGWLPGPRSDAPMNPLKPPRRPYRLVRRWPVRRPSAGRGAGAASARRSSGSAGPGCWWNWPARVCSTASGCGARTAAWTHASKLRTARQMLIAIGIEGFAERARHELLSTGETVRRYTAETAGELTAREAQIGWLAGDGHTNPEIGIQLFISARTVEWHLRKVFTKLGVSSRKELRRMLPRPRAGRCAGPEHLARRLGSQ
jgi:DNA-binding CsgD family transcriptional regulator